MCPVVRISDELFRKLEERAVGFDTPANVIERLINNDDKKQVETGGRVSNLAERNVPKDTQGLIEFALENFFKVTPRPFGQKAGVWIGASDGNTGVQWNIGFNRETDETVLGVNLEGMKYGGRWPITKFLLRERDKAQLTNYSSIPDANLVNVHLTRDAWQMAARPAIVEQNIFGCGISLDQLSTALWEEMIEEALNCLNPSLAYMGRGKSSVTLLKSGKQVERETSPHLTVRTALWRKKPTTLADLESCLTAAKKRLDPIYALITQCSE